MIENWIDEIAKLFAVDDGRGGHVRSYQPYGKAEFPEAITVYPCAITYSLGVSYTYSEGGPNIGLWKGVTEFHLTAGVSKADYPYCMRYFKRILDAAAGNMTLSGQVQLFIIDNEVEYNILGPVALTYGSGEPHNGLMVYWKVKENTDVAPRQYLETEQGEYLNV